MPNTPVHDFLTVASGIVIAPGIYGVLYEANVSTQTAVIVSALVFVSHLVSGIWFSPDLDLDSRIHKRWGWFFYIWLPYKWIIPHRHFWSHGLLLPPLVRLGYFFGMIIISIYLVESIASLVGMPIPIVYDSIALQIMMWVTQNQLISISIAVGFITGGAVHSIADWLHTGGKKLIRTLFVPRRGSASARKGINFSYASIRWLIDPFCNDHPHHY
ncbi:MAG: metal-binding protein [Roseiflexaceae bacterium]|jgi:uncharacterized metal-binding protein